MNTANLFCTFEIFHIMGMVLPESGLPGLTHAPEV